MKRVIIKKNEYRDSLFLMRLSNDVSAWPEVKQAIIVMGTPNNKYILEQAGLFDKFCNSATNDDLIIAVELTPNSVEEVFLTHLDQYMNQPKHFGWEENYYSQLDTAMKEFPEANIVVISTPGEHAVTLAKEALVTGKHVFCFSHHISIEDEIYLKSIAVEKGLLMMGPDCGTSIIDGIGFGFANNVRSGNVGIVSASGSGLQEVTTLIHRAGGGISQAIGVGGRDMQTPVDGMMSVKAVELVARHPETKALVILSKNTSALGRHRVLQAARKTRLPIIVNFHESDEEDFNYENIFIAQTYAECAKRAVEYLGLPWNISMMETEAAKWLTKTQNRLKPEQWTIRGLFSGGSLCGETAQILQTNGLFVQQNLEGFDSSKVKGHLLIDLGDEKYTEGRPHPFIDPFIRTLEINKAYSDPNVAVILLDVVLGWGSHPDPASAIAKAIKDASGKNSNYLGVICSICGTLDDFQGYEQQRHILEEVGAYIAESNAAASQLSLQLITNLRRKHE